MRVETETMYKEWYESPSVKRVQIPSGQSNKNVFQEEDIIFDTSLFTKGRDIFKRPKKEVYELLKKDPFVRLKLTSEFRDFIKSFQTVASESQ